MASVATQTGPDAGSGESTGAGASTSSAATGATSSPSATSHNVSSTRSTATVSAATYAVAAGSRLSAMVHSPFFVNFIAGGMAGCVSRTVVSPLERMKIIFQIQTPGSQNYKGVWPTLVKMWTEEGFAGFMRGNGSNCLRIFPYSAIQFASYNIYKPFFLAEGESELTVTMRLVAGGFAGITSVAMTYPLDICRTRLSIQCADLNALNRNDSLGMWGTMKDIYRNEGGIFGLYRGIMPTIYGVAPYVGLNFAVYESVRKRFSNMEGGEPTAMEKLAAGAISGAVAQSITYPFDVLRRRFQVNSMLGNPYASTWHACKTIFAKEGLRGFYQGLSANLLKVIPSMSSSWLTFEMTRSWLIKYT